MAEDKWIGLTAETPFEEPPGKPKRRLLARARVLLITALATKVPSAEISMGFDQSKFQS